MAQKISDERSKYAGILMIAAAVEIVISVLVAQHAYPNYSLMNNYISDLGVGSTSATFNTAIQLFGILLIITSLLLWKRHRYAAIGFALVGLGGIGVGTFPETTGLAHIISAMVTFSTVMLLAMGFSRLFKGYMSYYSVVAGTVGLIVLVLFMLSLATGTSITFGLGKGGVEEILFYDELLWALITGIYFAKGRL